VRLWNYAAPTLAVVALSQYVQHGYAADLLDSGDRRGPTTPTAASCW
jgi:hypothetical protein